MKIRIMTKEEKDGIEYLNEVLDDFNVISSYHHYRREMKVNGNTYNVTKYIIDIDSIEISNYLTLIEKLRESKKYHYTIFEL